MMEVLLSQPTAFSSLDEVLRGISAKTKDFYVRALCGEEERYLFVIDGSPYCAAGEKKLADIKDFFVWFREKDSAAIEVVKADKRLLFCMLVTLNYAADKTFSTIEEAVEEITGSAVISARDGKRRVFALFIDGKAAYTDAPGEGAPRERLIRCLRGKTPSLEVYTRIRLSPAADSGPFPEEDMAAFYAGEAKRPEPACEAYVELLEDDTVKEKYPVIGELTIGREATNAVLLTEAGVSRHHAVIKGTNGKYLIKDLGSANGTFFRGIRIAAKELFEGDEIKIRKYTLRFHGPKKKEEAKYIATAEAEKSPSIKGPSIVLEDGAVHPLGAITNIGSAEDMDIRLEGVFVSKRHAVIVRSKDTFKLIKKGVLSPVKVNGEKVEEYTLKDGDMIEIANHRITFKE